MQWSSCVIVPILLSLLRLPSCNSARAGGSTSSEGSGARTTSGDAGTSADSGGSASGTHTFAGAADGGAPKKRIESTKSYSVPFIWDPDSEDPVARARNLLRQISADNATFRRQHDAKYFKAFFESQKPRVTLVTCSDSRVQSSAFDATPDNDLFVVRNIGNQVKTSAGSVQYGVERLKTPLLFIVGHTGCSAVKAVLSGASETSEAIRRELQGIDLSPIAGKRVSIRRDKSASSEDRVDSRMWLEAVLINIHRQVAIALDTYPEQVAMQDLIIVGILYDFRNDMHLGHGSVSIVNVNGHTDIAELASLKRTLGASPNTEITLGPVDRSGGHRALDPALLPPSLSAGSSAPSLTAGHAAPVESAEAAGPSASAGAVAGDPESRTAPSSPLRSGESVKPIDVPRTLRVLEELAGIREAPADAGPAPP